MRPSLRTSPSEAPRQTSRGSRRAIGALLLIGLLALPGIAVARDGRDADVELRSGGIPIFPGAVGYGRMTVAGRGTTSRPATVYKVTSCEFEGETDNSGNVVEIGLQQCLEGDPNRPPEGDGSTSAANFDPRVCVFEVSCYIDLPGNVIIDKPYLTIAGQTAPSPGVTLRFGKLDVQTHNVLVQHIAARAGFSDDVPPWASFAIGAQSKGLSWQTERVHDLYFDHVSASFGRDANWSFHAQMDSPSGTDFGGLYARNITVAHSISSEALALSGHVDANPPECWPCQPGVDPGCHENWEQCDGEHGFDPSMCSWDERRCAFREPTIHSMAMRVSAPFRELSLVGNLFASNHARSPKLQGSHQSINNVVYNWGSKSFDLDAKILDPIAPVVADLIANVVLDGPDSSTVTPPVHLRRQIVEGEVEIFFRNNAVGGLQQDDSWSDPEPPGDPYDPDDFLRYNPSDIPDGYPKNPQLDNLIQPGPIHPRGPNGIVVKHWTEVLDQVRENAGTRPYDRLGSGERADPTDRRVLARLDGHGITTEFVDCVGAGDVTTQIPKGYDLDCSRNAGGWPPIPEKRRSLTLPPDPQGDSDGDGYTNLEEWLHEAACEVACPPGDLCAICDD